MPEGEVLPVSILLVDDRPENLTALRAILGEQPGFLGSAVLVPKSAELSIEPADVFLDLRVVLRGEAMPQFGALLTEALDLRVDRSEGGDSDHVS